MRVSRLQARWFDRASGARLAATVVALLVVLMLALFASSAQAVSYSNQEVELVRLLNDYRQSLGLQPLMVSDLCSDAAEKHSSDMGKYSFFSHTSLQSDYFPIGANGRVRMSTCGYPYSIAWGENIAAGYTTAAGVIQAWRGSSTHDRVMTDPVVSRDRYRGGLRARLSIRLLLDRGLRCVCRLDRPLDRHRSFVNDYYGSALDHHHDRRTAEHDHDHLASADHHQYYIGRSSFCRRPADTCLLRGDNESGLRRSGVGIR